MPDIREVPRVWHPRDTGEQKRAPGLAPRVTGVMAYLAQESYSAQSPHAARDLLGERGVVVQDALRVAGDFGELGVQLPPEAPVLGLRGSSNHTNRCPRKSAAPTGSPAAARSRPAVRGCGPPRPRAGNCCDGREEMFARISLDRCDRL